MITNNEVMTKLNALKNYSVAESTATESLFQPLEDAISLYFDSSSSEMTTALEDVVKYMYNDISRRTTEYENNFDMNLASDLENVKKLAEWCKNSGGSCDLISLLEEQGQIKKSLNMKEIATIIYQEKKLIDVIRSKNLKVYKPSWMV